MRFLHSLTLNALLLCGLPVLAQTDKPATTQAGAPPTYKLTFAITQLIKGKQEGRRIYSVLFTPSLVEGSLRAENRVPVPNGANSGTVITNYNYTNVGVDIDFHTPKELADKYPDSELPLYLSANISSYSPSTTPGLSAPFIRQDQWKSNSVLPLNKPTLLFSSDDPAIDQTTQLELTVTRNK